MRFPVRPAVLARQTGRLRRVHLNPTPGKAGQPIKAAVSNRARQSSVVPVGATEKSAAPSEPKQPWHSFSPPALAAVNTTGNLFSLAAAAVHDHMAVRALAGSTSLCVVAFNVLMPKPLKTHQRTAAGWGMVFAVLHFVNLGFLLREQHAGINLSEEEEDIYEHGFQRFGVTPRQFRRLLNAGARVIDYGPGEIVAELGKPVDKIFYVTHGTCLSEASPGHDGEPGCVVLEYHQDVFIGELHPRRWRAEYLGCGETLDAVETEDQRKEREELEDAWLIEHATATATRRKNRTRDSRKLLQEGMEERMGSLTRLHAGAAWTSRVKAGPSGCRMLVWPLGSFTCAVGAEEKFCQAMERIDEMGLAAKISTGSSRKALEGYKELLDYVVSDGRVDPAQKHALHRYRARHAVPDAEHQRMLAEVGWTEAEYDDGILESSWRATLLGWRQSKSEKESSPKGTTPAQTPYYSMVAAGGVGVAVGAAVLGGMAYNS